MSRKARAPSRRRKAPPKTDTGELNKLPQFRPGPSFDIDHIDIQTGSLSAFPPERLKEIRNVLTEHIQSHVRVVEWSGEPTGLERFLREAVKAIEIYVNQRKVERAFDREKAKILLTQAVEAVRVAQLRLQAIAGWTELSSFLESIFALQKSATSKEISLREFFKAARTQRKRRVLRTLEPKFLANLLIQLEPLLGLAAERVTFQPGDYQRDETAREFMDAMAFAWICGTGRLPTYSSPSLHIAAPPATGALLRDAVWATSSLPAAFCFSMAPTRGKDGTSHPVNP
jgi:hypothetical protein